MTLVPKLKARHQARRRALDSDRRGAQARRPRPGGRGPQPGAHPAHRHADRHGETRGARRRAADGRRDRRQRARAGADQHAVRGLDPEARWSRRPASGCGAARRWRPSTAPTCCAPSRSCWSRAAGTRPAAPTPGRPMSTTLHGRAGRRAPAAGWSCSGSPRQEIDEVLRTGKAVEAIAIRSPVDGYVVARTPWSGVAVQPGTVLFEVADLSHGLGDRRRLRAGRLARPRRPEGARSSCRRSRESCTRARCSSSTRCSTREPDAARAARVQEPDRPQRPSCGPGMYGNVYARSPADDGADGAGRGGGRHGRDAVRVRREGGRPLRAAHGEGRRARSSDTRRDPERRREGETVVTTGNFLHRLESRLRAAIEGADRERRQEVAAMVDTNHRVLRAQPAAGPPRRRLRAGRRRSSPSSASKLDAIPDLSDPQVIVFTEWMGRSPTLVEDQVTYPIVSTLLGAPHVTDVRGFSMFGMSFVYVDLRGGHRRLLGAQPRARVPERHARRAARGRRRRRSGPTRPASAGSSSTRSSTRPASTASTSCAPSRTSPCATRSAACRASPRSRASAATRSSTRSPSIPNRLRAYGVTLVGGHRRHPRSRTTTSAAASSRCPGASTTCAGAATSQDLGVDRERSRCAPSGAERHAGAGQGRRRRCASAPTSGAACSSGTARARRSAASWSCATARTRSTSSSG